MITPQPSIGDGTRPRAARRVRPLIPLVVANAVSLTGNVIAAVAVPWLVLTTTGSAALAGLALFASAAAAVIGGLAAGRIVDAVGATRASAGGDVLSALAVAPLPILLALDALQLPHIVALAFLGALADSAASTARQSLVPAAAVAGGHGRERANALFTSAEHVAYLLGAPVAGVLIGLVGVGGALWVTVATFAVAAILVGALVRVTPRGPVAAAERRVRLVEVARFIWSDPALRALVIFPTTATLLIGPLVPIVLPVMARAVFGDAISLGLLVGAFGTGGLIGTAAFGMFGQRLPRRRVFLAVNVAWPAIYGTIALVPSLPVATIAVFSLGAVAGSLVPMMATIRQERSPAHLLPRVVGLSTAGVPVVGPVSVLVTGVLLDAMGVAQTLLIMTAATAMLAIGSLRSEGIRAFDETRPQEPRITPVGGRLAGAAG
jgi:predicted MFS family arabinose efflux permease